MEMFHSKPEGSLSGVFFVLFRPLLRRSGGAEDALRGWTWTWG